MSKNALNKKIFLGGTVNSIWRDELIPILEELKLPYFNPIVKDWNELDRIKEEKMKLECPIHLFIITPNQEGIFSYVEAALARTIYNAEFTAFMFVSNDGTKEFTKARLKNHEITSKLLLKAGIATFFNDPLNLLNWLHSASTGGFVDIVSTVDNLLGHDFCSIPIKEYYYIENI